MSELYFASHNLNKVKEIQSIVGDRYTVKSLHDLNLTEEIPETGDTLEDNAVIKAQYLHDRFQVACFADDSGLEVSALNGAPGVYSARFAGPQKDSMGNMTLLLEQLAGQNDRTAQFRTIICFIESDGSVHTFEGAIHGSITETKIGGKGFGYDPIFKPAGYDLTFGQMTSAVKNKISHRALAMQKLQQYLGSKN
jgi:XTP/dITP diphosphohydrolase